MNTRTRLVMLSALIAFCCGGCGSIHHRVSAEIDRPVGKAWTVFADEERLGEWMHDSWAHGKVPWVQSGARHIGRPQRVTFREDGKELVVTQTITSIKEDEEFGFTLDHEWMQMENTFRFTPRGASGSTVEWDATIHPKGAGRSAMMAPWRGAIGARYKEHLGKLKALVEGEQ